VNDSRGVRYRNQNIPGTVPNWFCAIEQHPNGMTEIMNLFTFHTRALHADDVQSAKMGMHTNRHTIRDKIAYNSSHTANESVVPNAHKLMDSRTTSQNSVVSNCRVTANHHIVGECNVIANIAVMGYMRIG